MILSKQMPKQKITTGGLFFSYRLFETICGSLMALSSKRLGNL